MVINKQIFISNVLQKFKDAYQEIYKPFNHRKHLINTIMEK